MHMFCNEFFFSTNSHAFSLRISCTYMVRNCNYFLQFLFLLRIGFYKILIRLLIIIIYYYIVLLLLLLQTLFVKTLSFLK